MLVLEFLAKNKTVIMAQPPYSLDLAAPADIFLFPKLKTQMKGKRFTAIDQGFFTMITHQLTHRGLCMSFCSKTKL